MDENTLLTIGIGPGEDGLGLDWSMTQISFSMSHPTNSSSRFFLCLRHTDENCDDVRTCGWSWSWSEATYEHKAFTYWALRACLRFLFHIPMHLRCRRRIWLRVCLYVELVNVDAENLSLSEHGEVDHSPFYNNDDSDVHWWFSYSTNIRRSIFMGVMSTFSALGANDTALLT